MNKILADGKMSRVELRDDVIIIKTFKCPLMFLKEKFVYNNFPSVTPNVIKIDDTNRSISIERLLTWRELKDSLTDEDKQDIAKQIIKLLKFLWDNGYVHGDLHMDNVVFSEKLKGFKAHLIDFEWFHHKIHDKFEDSIDINGHSFVSCFDGSYRSVKVALGFTKEDTLEVQQ